MFWCVHTYCNSLSHNFRVHQKLKVKAYCLRSEVYQLSIKNVLNKEAPCTTYKVKWPNIAVHWYLLCQMMNVSKHCYKIKKISESEIRNKLHNVLISSKQLSKLKMKTRPWVPPLTITILWILVEYLYTHI